MSSRELQLPRLKYSDRKTTLEIPGSPSKFQEVSKNVNKKKVTKHEEQSTKGQEALWNIVNCQEASVLEAVQHCLSWTALFTLLLLLLWPLLQNRHSKLIMFFRVLATSLGPSPQSSKPCQQSFPCCTVCLVWLALWARENSLWLHWAIHIYSVQYSTALQWTVCYRTV